MKTIDKIIMPELRLEVTKPVKLFIFSDYKKIIQKYFRLAEQWELFRIANSKYKNQIFIEPCTFYWSNNIDMTLSKGVYFGMDLYIGSADGDITAFTSDARAIFVRDTEVER